MQGKSPKQYRDSMRFAGLAAFGIVGIICIMVIGTMMPQSDDTMETDPTYWIPTEADIQSLDSLHNIVKETNTDLDTVRRSLDRCLDKLDEIYEERKSEYHGKEGKSEYGEYEPYNEWMEKQ
jgi:hypothetical protein